MLRMTRLLQVAAFGLLLTFNQAVSAAEKTSFKVAWSIYVGWMPWDYAESSGILKKWADKHGLHVAIALEPYGKIFQFADASAFPVNMFIRVSDMKIVFMRDPKLSRR